MQLKAQFWALRRPSIGAIALFLTVAAAALGASHAFTPKKKSPELVAFSQPSANQVELKFDDNVDVVAVARFPAVPAAFDLSRIPPETLELVAQNTAQVKIELQEQSINAEYSIVVLALKKTCLNENEKKATARIQFNEGCIPNEYIELVRQSPKWLMDRFGFKRDNGYSILGRRSVQVGTGQPPSMGPLRFVGRADIDLSNVSVNGIAPELQKYAQLTQAAKIMTLLWSKDFLSGPTSIPYSEFLQHGFQEKLSLIREGRFAIMCQGMRDLFLHAAVQNGLRVRAVEALNYPASFPDLTNYSHSTVEIWIDSLNKWVLADPWVGVSVVDSDGKILSAEEISSAQPTSVRVLPLLPAVQRFTASATGEKRFIRVVPSDIELERYTTGMDGHSPGFLIYFRHFIYRGFEIDNGA